MGSKMNKLYSFEHLIVLFNLDGSHLLYFSYYNNFTMNKLDPKYRRFVNLQGYLEKKSENLFVGFQMKYWRVLQNGTKIGYSNQKDDVIKAENIFLVKECLASESSGNNIFQLETRDRIFILKAPNEQERTDWIKGLTYLKKLCNNQVKLKKQLSPTQTTMASKSQKIKNKKVQTIQTSVSIKIQKPKIFHPDDLNLDTNTQSDLIQQLIRYLPEKCLKYYTLITHLKIKSQGLFVDSFNSDTYLMISPKSLYPDVYIGEQNLTNVSLPPWLEINVFYKILNTKQRKKQIFHVSKIIDIQKGSEKCSLKINTGQIIYQFFTQSIEQKQCLQNCLEIGAINAQQVLIKGKVSKKNYDHLIQLHQTKLPQFQAQSKKIVSSFLKDPQSSKYEPSSLFYFMEGSMTFLRQFIQVLQNKKKNKDHVILDMLKQFHEEVKMQTKLTWDSSYFNIKGIEILNILKKLSQYYEIMKNFIKSGQFLEGMKELSKIYVRESWRNFESIIISIVQQQKKQNFLQDEYSNYLQTHGVTDLFKFIYNVYDLAAPHWKNKIHLHNVNRLMQRALQVFVNQLRSTIDQQVIPIKQMMALANNYFCFSEYVKEFYTDKFQELAQKTHQSYQKIISSYRQVSSIILQKLSSHIGAQLGKYCQKCSIQTVKSQNISQILVRETSLLQKCLHMAFIQKLHEKLSKQVHLQICNLVVNEVNSKKKLKLKQIIRCIKDLRADFNKLFLTLFKNNKQMDKKMGELDVVLSFDLYSDIQSIISSNNDPLKDMYLKILSLRQDYYEGSALYRIITQSQPALQNKYQPKRTNTKIRRASIQNMMRQKNATLSRQYFQQEMMDSDDRQDDTDKQNQTQSRRGGKQSSYSKLISEGYLTKGKRNHKVWEKQYFRLKNGFLYVFQSIDSEKCNNAIQIKNLLKVQVTNPEKPSFLLTYKTLGKQKQIKLKAESIELRERWVHSLELQKKRLMNEEQVKKKNIKYRETMSNGRKKNQMIIDYEELEKGKDYFSYSN